MSRFSLTKQAIEDLREIGRYTQKRWGQDQRRYYLALLDRCFHTLAENPNQGQRCTRPVLGTENSLPVSM